MKRVAVVAALAMTVAAAGLRPAAAADDTFPMHRYEKPIPAPALRVPDLEGRVVDLAELRDKVVLVFFWATW